MCVCMRMRCVRCMYCMYVCVCGLWRPVTFFSAHITSGHSCETLAIDGMAGLRFGCVGDAAVLLRSIGVGYRGKPYSASR